MNYRILQGDCLELLRTIPENSVDSIVTDPPYGLSKEPDMAEVLRHWMAGDDYHHKGGGFMGKSWDSFVPGPSVWKECLRVLKPGGHLLAFFGTRTQDIGTLAIRLAGFEIRDSIAWVYGSGFPKSMDVSKAIDKAAGAEREVVGRAVYGDGHVQNSSESMGYGGCDPDADQRLLTAPATEAARQWQGWGTALKPALEPITVARKPLIGTVAANVLAHGTGALNIDGCRVATRDDLNGGAYSDSERRNQFFKALDAGVGEYVQPIGRWPANLILDDSDEVVGLFPVTTSGGGNKSRRQSTEGGNCYGTYNPPPPDIREIDTGSAARFFYCAKASKRDRGEGNNHPTVKPTDLMAYLCRLVTPPGGTVLDPFMGSGSTGKAAMREGFRFIGCELSPEYLEIAEARIRQSSYATMDEWLDPLI